MNIEKEIYNVLMSNARFKQNEINDISQPTLRLLKEGSGKTSIYKVFDILFSNGIESVKIKTKTGSLTFDAKKREVLGEPIKK